MKARRVVLLSTILIIAIAGFLSNDTTNAIKGYHPIPTTVIPTTSRYLTTFSSYQIPSPVTTVYANVSTPITNQTSVLNFTSPPTTASGIVTVTMITTTTTSYIPTSSTSSTTTAFLTSTVTVTPSTIPVTITGAPEFAVTTPNVVSLVQGGQTAVTVNVQSINGFSGQVMLNAPDLPSGVLGGFVPNPVVVPPGGIATSQLTLSAAKNTVVAAYTFTIMAVGQGVTKYVSVQLYVSSRPGPCLIATATYGSALSPEVRFLRNFRDHTILRTFAGSSFMMVFNDWYYSFSPQVAQYEYAHPALQALMRGVLYPVMGTLHVSAAVFSLLSSQPEFAALVSGIVAGLGLGFIFLALPTTVLMSRMRKRVRMRYALMLPAAFAVLTLAFWLTEFMLLTGLMMVVSSSLVLLALATGALLPSILLGVRKN